MAHARATSNRSRARASTSIQQRTPTTAAASKRAFDPALIQHTDRWRSSLRELQWLAQAFHTETEWDERHTDELDFSASSDDPMLDEEASLSEGPDDDADDVINGEPEPEELAAFEQSLREDLNAEVHRDAPLTINLADWHVLRVTMAKRHDGGNQLQCRYVPKTWMQPRPPAAGQVRDDVDQFLTELCTAFDQVATALETRLPRFLADPTPRALADDWRDLRRNRSAELPGKVFNEIVPSEQIGFIELVFDGLDVLKTVNDSTRRGRFNDMLTHALLHWQDTGHLMPLRQWFDNADWKAQLTQALAEQTPEKL